MFQTLGQALDTEALVEIPKGHFATFEFDPTALAQVDNYDLFTTKLGNSPGVWKGQIFRDLHVNADLARAWLAGVQERDARGRQMAELEERLARQQAQAEQEHTRLAQEVDTVRRSNSAAAVAGMRRRI